MPRSGWRGGPCSHPRIWAAFLRRLVRYALLAVTLVLILQVVGIQATSLVAVIGANSAAIGLALQGTLANITDAVVELSVEAWWNPARRATCAPI
jgi:small-conductance mechanosensitive channel